MFGTGTSVATRTRRSYALSLAAHALGIGALLGLVRLHPAQLAMNKLPGTALGNRTLVYYSPGAPPHTAVAKPATPKPAAKTKPTIALSAPHETAPPAPVAAEKGTGSTSESGAGEGDLRIALPAYFPTPAPSLASMPTGTAGDVILDAVIDEHGRITQLTVLKGLTPAINQQVLATVQQWTYTPAMRDGTPVASGQELHFHFERSSVG